MGIVPVYSRAPGAGGHGALASVAVGLLVLVAMGLRALGLPGPGPVFYDEGWGARDGRFIVEIARHPGYWSQLPHGTRFPFGQNFKPIHDLVLGSILQLGARPQELIWATFVAGVILVVVVTALAASHWGKAAGATAGVFVAVAPLSIMLGHRVLAETDGLAVLMIAVYLWARWIEHPSRKLLAATLAGFALTMGFNYRLIPTVLPFVGALAWLAWQNRRQGARRQSRSSELFLIGLLPGVTMTAVYLLVAGWQQLHLPRIDLPYFMHDELLRSGSGTPLPFTNVDFYFRTLLEFGGLAFVAAVLLGVVALTRAPRKISALDVMTVGTLAGSLLFFSAVYDKAPRAILVCVPFAALIAARGITLWRQPAARWAAAIVLSAGFLVTGWAGSASIRQDSGTVAAGEWLAARQGDVATSLGPVYVLYVGWHRWDIGGFPSHRRVVDAGKAPNVSALREEGVRWAVVDVQSLALPGDPALKELVTCGRPQAEFADSSAWSRLVFLDYADTLHLGYDAALERRGSVLAANGGKESISIYDLTDPSTGGCK